MQLQTMGSFSEVLWHKLIHLVKSTDRRTHSVQPSSQVNCIHWSFYRRKSGKSCTCWLLISALFSISTVCVVLHFSIILDKKLSSLKLQHHSWKALYHVALNSDTTLDYQNCIQSLWTNKQTKKQTCRCCKSSSWIFWDRLYTWNYEQGH